MKKTEEYYSQAKKTHIKKYGQFFTEDAIAEFMVDWACQGAKQMFDPAVGNSIFFRMCQKQYGPKIKLYGYEIDRDILHFFGNPSSANIQIEDYLLGDWDKTYDAIVCNPPYHRFQIIDNRESIQKSFQQHTGIRCSGYTNMYILFLIKSLSQMTENGRLAYIIPTEFLNSSYGMEIKKLLTKKRLLKAIINFKNDDLIFENATTTCCILLADHSQKEGTYFYQIESVEELNDIKLLPDDKYSVFVPYDEMKPEKKWRNFLCQEAKTDYKNIRKISDFCFVTRGIATGDNEFFCLTPSDVKRHAIPENCLMKCVTRSAEVNTLFFEENDMQQLEEKDRKIFLLNATEKNKRDILNYLKLGQSRGVDKKYLPAHRSPWYSMEQKKAAPIWISTACRKSIKVVRNLSDVRNLTTFHSVFVREEYQNDIDIIFCYLITPVAQKLLRENRKEMGNGLEKFQPNDMNRGFMLDITLLSKVDILTVRRIYEELKEGADPVARIEQLNAIFEAYILADTKGEK